jgi:uncharacterized protein with von Willebrand factor type A (vWA) domain
MPDFVKPVLFSTSGRRRMTTSCCSLLFSTVNLTATHLSQSNSTLFRHYASFLANNPELKKIADDLGRAATQDSHAEEHIEKVEVQELQYVQHDNVPDDLVGIHQSNELNRLISSETVLLTEPELETVFYKQLAERRLLNYQFMGQSRSLETVLSERRTFGETQDTKGPFIVCIDTSGSMSGYPEDCAKGFCFALLQIALSENRITCFWTNRPMIWTSRLSCGWKIIWRIMKIRCWWFHMTVTFWILYVPIR